jgi:hypothetical protein
VEDYQILLSNSFSTVFLQSTYEIVHMCGFNAFTHAMFYSFKYHESINVYIDGNLHNLFCAFIKQLSSHKTRNNQEAFKIIHNTDLFRRKLQEANRSRSRGRQRPVTVDMAASVNEFFGICMPFHSSIFITCISCNYTTTERSVQVTIHNPLQQYNFLDALIVNSVQANIHRICLQCRSRLNEVTSHELIFVDVYNMHPLLLQEMEHHTTVEKIPTSFRLNDRPYSLVFIISRHGFHFKTFFKQSDESFIVINDINSSATFANGDEVVSPQIIAYKINE